MKRSTKIRICRRGAPMLFYPAVLPLSRQILDYVAGMIAGTASGSSRAGAS
jgi:hypothetical protein